MTDGQNIFNDGAQIFKVVLEGAPYQINVQRMNTSYGFDHDAETFKVTAINMKNHSMQKTAMVAISNEAIINNFYQNYDRNTFFIEQLIAKRFMQWAKENPNIRTPKEGVLPVISADVPMLSGENVSPELAEAHLASFLLGAFRVFPGSTFNLQDLFVSTILNPSDLKSAVDYFYINATNIISDFSADCQQMKLNPEKIDQARAIADRLVDNATVSKVVRPQIESLLKLHPELEKASKSLFSTAHYADAVFKGCLALCEYVRQKTGLKIDASRLMQTAFSQNAPLLPLNSGISQIDKSTITQTDKDEQVGFMNIFLGVMQAIRNPRAHSTREDSPERATAYLGLLSLLFEIVDEAEARKSAVNP
jgi:uncharacterized protein (TIGR02391 family)